MDFIEYEYFEFYLIKYQNNFIRNEFLLIITLFYLILPSPTLFSSLQWEKKPLK